MPTTIFRPTSPTNQNRPKVKISNFCVFCPIWIKFGIWAHIGPKIIWYKFEIATATFYASTKSPHIPSRTIILFRFFFFIFFLFFFWLFFFNDFFLSMFLFGLFQFGSFFFSLHRMALILGAHFVLILDTIRLSFSH